MSTGVVALWRRLRIHASESTCVELRPWTTDVWELAELIWRLRPPSGPVRIVLVGYSWGGYTAVMLARELGRRGIEVDAMVLSDAVYRHRYWLGQWRAVVPWTEILVPPKVRQVYWLRQRETCPRGHDVVPVDRHLTTVHPAVWLDMGHRYADDAPEFHRLAMEVAA